VERLLFFQAGDEYFEEFLQSGYSEIFSTVVVDRHLLDFRVLFYKLALLSLESCFPILLPLLGAEFRLICGVAAVALGI